jgi:chitinase
VQYRSESDQEKSGEELAWYRLAAIVRAAPQVFRDSATCRVTSLLILTFSAATPSDAQQQYRVVGYYPMYARTALPASAINYSILTHINHAFAWPNADGTIASYESTVDTALINATHRAGRKILLSFGGAGATQTSNFALIAGDTALRRTFVSNVVSRLSTYHYDGADLDWEGPVNLTDKTNEVALVQQLWSALRAVDTSLSITMAIGPSNWSGQWHDYSALLPFVDWFNAMEYDFHGSWSKYAGHNAPLYIGSDPNTDPDFYSIDLSIQYLSGTRAIPRSKLVLGIPFYGKAFGTSVLYTTFSGEEDITYRDILDTIKTGTWKYNWDSGSQAPYYTSMAPAKLITLDDSASIAAKCQYAIQQSLSGVMIWEITQDLIGGSQPLLDVIGALMVTTGVGSEPQRTLIPAGFQVFNNYPNPFNPSTTIQYAIPASSHVSMKVFDVLGREIATIVDENRPSGINTVRFDASPYNIPSGVYFYRTEAGRFVQTKKMSFVK